MRRNDSSFRALLCIVCVVVVAAASSSDAEDDGRARRPPAARAGDAGAGADESVRRPGAMRRTPDAECVHAQLRAHREGASASTYTTVGFAFKTSPRRCWCMKACRSCSRSRLSQLRIHASP